MVIQSKTINISIAETEGAFLSLLSKFVGDSKNSSISNLRQILSNEKAKLLHVIKTKKPDSIYELAKLLGRDFKAVRHDIKLLEQFGFVELISSHKQGRERLKPIVDADQIVITIAL